jgi:hypothetical protein
MKIRKVWVMLAGAAKCVLEDFLGGPTRVKHSNVTVNTPNGSTTYDSWSEYLDAHGHDNPV